MYFRLYSKNSIVYADNGEVQVILNGWMEMSSHKHKVFPPKFLARYEEGDIIGSPYGSKESLRRHNWLVTLSPAVVAVFKPSDFDILWRWQWKINVNVDK